MVATARRRRRWSSGERGLRSHPYGTLATSEADAGAEEREGDSGRAGLFFFLVMQVLSHGVVKFSSKNFVKPNKK